jgi:hypothetical protein
MWLSFFCLSWNSFQGTVKILYLPEILKHRMPGINGKAFKLNAKIFLAKSAQRQSAKDAEKICMRSLRLFFAGLA